MFSYACNNQYCLCNGESKTTTRYQHVFDANKRVVFSELLTSFLDRYGNSLPIENMLRVQCKNGFNAITRLLIKSRDIHFSTPISLNIEPIQLNDIHFIQELSEKLQVGDIIEITESSALDLNKKQVLSLNIILNSGLKLAVDDFGTGNCNFDLFKIFPVDFIKASKEMLSDHSLSLDKLMTITNFLSKYTVCLVAEGVENQTEFEIYKKAGFNLYQGYLFHKPEPIKILMTEI